MCLSPNSVQKVYLCATHPGEAGRHSIWGRTRPAAREKRTWHLVSILRNQGVSLLFLRIGNQTELSCHRWCQLQEDQFDVDQVSDEDFNPGHTSAVTDAVKVSQNLRVHTSHSSLTQNMSSGWNNLTKTSSICGFWLDFSSNLFQLRGIKSYRHADQCPLGLTCWMLRILWNLILRAHLKLQCSPMPLICHFWAPQVL